MRCPRCPSVDLKGGADLSASTCDRCGGGLVPDDGAQRLLVDELGHDRGALRELADLFGGVRIVCPACSGKMSPVRLRGALLDLCFQCGALWVDAGELEKVSAGRHHLPRALALPAVAAPAVAAPALATSMKIDERPFWLRRIRDVLWLYGGIGLLAAMLGSTLAPTVVFTLPALAVALSMSKKRRLELLPRARRMRRWRGFFPSTPSLEEELPADAMVVSAPLPIWRGEWFRRLTLVDGEGRQLVTLRHLVPEPDADRVGEELARALGVSLRHDLPRPKEPLEAVEAVIPDAADLIVRADDSAQAGRIRLSVVARDSDAIAYATNRVPLADAPRSLAQLLAADWVVTDVHDRVLVRLLPSARYQQRATLLLAADGALLGHVLVRRSFFFDVVEWASPARRRLAHLRIPHAALETHLRDQRGRSRGKAHLTRRPGAPASIELSYMASAYPGALRLGVVAALVHASLAGSVVDI